MDIAGKVVVVTGAAAGIGRALALAAHAAGARQVVVTDLDGDGACAVAGMVGGDHYALNVRDEAAITEVVRQVEYDHGGVDLFCSNAGIIALDGEPWWAPPLNSRRSVASL